MNDTSSFPFTQFDPRGYEQALREGVKRDRSYKMENVDGAWIQGGKCSLA
jgi:hypothetical protein